MIDLDFVIDKCPIGLMVFDQKLDIVYCNRQAAIFLKNYTFPPEATVLTKRIFQAVEDNRLSELFPGEIYLTDKLDGSPSNWIFRLYICEKPDPLVYVIIIEEKLSNKIPMDDIRKRFRLTRRETDIVRRVVDGLKNVEIAEDLQIAEQTVKDHLSHIYKKAGAEDRLTLIRTLVQMPFAK